MSSYDGRFVELTGYFNLGVEQSALSKKRNSQKKGSMIWIGSISDDIVDSLEKKSGPDTNVFKILKQRKITIKGMVDMDDQGHIDQYAAA